MERMQVILVDLDHTLIDHELTLQVVAQELNARFAGSTDTSDFGDVYLGLLKHWDLLCRLGLPNFRRNWLHPEIIGSVLAICRREVAPDIHPDWVSLLENNSKREEKDLVHFRMRLSEKTASLFAERAFRQEVERFIEHVESLDTLFPLCYGAESFLARAKEVGAIVYIVTEGDRKVQERKFRHLQLQRWVPYRRFITTDDLCHPPQLTELRALLKIIERKLLLNECSFPLPSQPISKLVKRNISLHEELRHALNRVPFLDQVAMLERLHQAVSGLVYFLSGARLKAHPSFFRFLLHSIWRDPLDPQKGFKMVFENTPLPAREVKLSVAGDRYDVDLYPVIALFGPTAITVRIRRGKYRDTYTSEQLECLNAPLPTFSCNNLDEATKYLTDTVVWSNAQWLMPPPLLSESMGHLRQDLEVCLMFPQESAPYIVANSILLFETRNLKEKRNVR
jgi:FMN phosphatase YigB (HAD superfamily)